MVTNYNITMKRYNGTDYDVLYPRTLPSQIDGGVYTKDEATGLFLSKTGGQMSGLLDMNGNKISNLAAPTAANDAATKDYVDNNSYMWNKVLLHEWTAVNADLYTMPKDNITNLIGLYAEYSFDTSSNISETNNVRLIIYQNPILNYNGGVVLYLAQSLANSDHVKGKIYSWVSETRYSHTANQRTTALTSFIFSNFYNLSPAAALMWTSVTGNTVLKVSYQSNDGSVTSSDFSNISVKLYGLYEK